MALGPLGLAALMGGIGLAKGELFDRPAEQQRALLEAEKTRYSPWTGMRGEDAKYKNSLEQGIGSAMGGAQFGAALESYETDKKLKEALANRINRSPYFSSGLEDNTSDALLLAQGMR